MTTTFNMSRPIFARGSAFLTYCFILWSVCAHGNTLTWNGGGSPNANWNNSANWGGAGTPNNGDTLIFKGGVNLVNTNNIAGLTLNQICFGGLGGGFDIRGNAFTLTNSIMATNAAGANLIENSITLVTSDALMIVSNNATLTLSGALGGFVGANKSGLGTLIYQSSGVNSYSGTTLVSAGTLQLNVSGISAFGGPLVIGDGTGNGNPTVQLLHNNEISNSAVITINDNGTLDLNNFSETIGPSLTMGTGYIFTGTGVLTLSPNTTIMVLDSSTPSIYDNLNIGSGTLTLQGDGNPLTLIWFFGNVTGSANIANNSISTFWGGVNTYTGNLTANGDSQLDFASSSAGGNINNTITINGQAQLAVSGNINITNQALIINGGSSDAALYSDGPATGPNGPGTNSWHANSFMITNASPIDALSNCVLNLVGPINGTGGLTKGGPGTVTFSGSTANNYSGPTMVSGGILQLGKSSSGAIPGALVLETNTTVRLLNNFQIDNPASSITLSNSSLLDLAGFSEWVGPITLQGAQISTGGGMLYFSSNITVNASAVAQSLISGNASIWNGTYVITNSGHNFSPDLVINANVTSGGIGGGGLIKDGIGEVALTGSNSFTGPVTVNNGILYGETSAAFANTNTPATVNNGGTLLLFGHGLDFGLKPLVLNGYGSYPLGALSSDFSNSWNGNITLASDSSVYVYPNSSLNLGGANTGSGAFIKTGPGTNIFSGVSANTYAGTTIVGGGTLILNKPSGLAVPGNLVISNSCVVRLSGPQQTTTAADVLVNSGGLFDFSTNNCYIDTLHGSGTVNFGNGGWTGIGYNNGSSEFDGSFTGIGYASGYTVGKFGSGTFTIGGNSTYTAGTTRVINGKLVINGSQPQISVSVDSSGTLAGTGYVGIITAFGTISPGNSLGILNSSNTTLSASGNFNSVINGTAAGSGYSQLNVTGTVSVAGALQVSMGSVGAVNDQYTIISNDGGEVVSGTFTGLPEGSSLMANNGVRLTISYHGGTGNDVVLTQTNLPPQPMFAGVQNLHNGSIQLNGLGLTNVTYTVWANTNLCTTNWISIGSAPVPGNTNTFEFTDTNAASYQARFYRFTWP